MKNTGIHEGPVRKGGLSNNNSSNKPRIVPTGQSDILLRNVLSQINNAEVAFDAGDRGSALAALKKAKKLLTDFYDEGGHFW
jgi:hypothetical protein